MKTGAKFIVLTFAFTLFTTRDAASAARTAATDTAKSKSQLPKPVFDALLHYTALNATSASRMSGEELKTIAAVLRRCVAPCNFLVFGLSHETLLWNSLNQKGRTVFVGDSTYLISKLEEKQPSIEAYDVQFTTKVSELYDLIEYYKGEVTNKCRPVQNLLFSDCKLAVNDLPNHISYTIFATHMEHLSELATIYPNVKVVHFDVEIKNKHIDFKFQLKDGPRDVAHYGLMLAGVAGLPSSVIESAKSITSEITHKEVERIQINFHQHHDIQMAYRVAQRLICLRYSNQDQDSIRQALQNLKETCVQGGL